MTPQELFELALSYYNGTEDIPQDYLKAYDLFLEAAETGHVGAQSYLSKMLSLGEGVDIDMAESVKWGLLAAEKGDANAQNRLGVRYCYGEGVEQDDTQAAKWFLRSANAGFPKAIGNIAYLYGIGKGVVQSDEEALKWGKKAADNGIDNTELLIGYYYAEESTRDYEAAVKWFTMAAEKGNPEAQNQLAIIYCDENYTGYNETKALYWFLRAGQNGDTDAQCNLGKIYAEGELGQAIDLVKAELWYLQAAENGLYHVYGTLGHMYMNGDSVQQDYHKAAMYLSRGAEKGDAFSQNCLAILYLEGKGVKQNNELALKYYTLSSDNGNYIATFNLAKYYQTVLVDDDISFKYYSAAAESGYPPAINMVGEFYELGKGVNKDLAKALENYITAAEKNCPRAHYNLGRFYYYGKVVPKDYNQARHLLLIAAEKDHADANVILGEMYYYGHGVEKNLEKATDLFKKAADLGSIKAMSQLAIFYKQGYGNPENRDQEILRLYETAAEEGDDFAQCELGNMYSYGKIVEADPEKSVYYYKLAADQGNSVAINSLGFHYSTKEVNYEESFRWYKKGMKLKSKNSYPTLNTAYSFLLGHGVEKNVSESIRLYMNCDSAQSVLRLSEMYMQGVQGKQDMCKAVKLWKILAEKGYKITNYYLAWAYYYGVGVSKNYDKAITLLQGAYPEDEYSSAFLSEINDNVNLPYKSLQEMDIKLHVPNPTRLQGELHLISGDRLGAIEIFSKYSDVDSYFKLSQAYYNPHSQHDMIQAEKYFNIALEQGQARAVFSNRIIELGILSNDVKFNVPMHLNEIEKYFIPTATKEEKWGYIYVLYCVRKNIAFNNVGQSCADDLLKRLHDKAQDVIEQDTLKFKTIFELCLNREAEEFVHEYQEYLLEFIEEGKEMTSLHPSDVYISTILSLFSSNEIGSILLLDGTPIRLIQRIPSEVYCDINCKDEIAELQYELFIDSINRDCTTTINRGKSKIDKPYDLVISTPELRPAPEIEADINNVQIKKITHLLSAKDNIKRAVVLVDQEFCSSYQTQMYDMREELYVGGYISKVCHLANGTFRDINSPCSLVVLDFVNINKTVTFKLGESVKIVDYESLQQLDLCLNYHLYDQDIQLDKDQESVYLKNIIEIDKGGCANVGSYKELKSSDFTSSILRSLKTNMGQTRSEDENKAFIAKYQGPTLFIKHDGGIKVAVNRTTQYYEPCANSYSLKVNENIVSIEYLTYLFLYDKRLSSYMQSITDCHGVFMPKDLLHKKIAIYTDADYQKQIVDDAIVKERHAVSSGVEYNIVLLSADEYNIDKSINEWGINIFKRITDINDREHSFDKLFEKYIEDPTKSMIDAIVIDSDMENHEDVYTYFNEIRDRHIHLYLLSSSDVPKISGSRLKDYFIRSNRCFNRNSEGFASRLFMKMRDDLDSSNAPQAKIRNKYKAVFEAADALDKKYPDIGVSKTILRYIQTGCNIDDVDNVSGPCGSFRNVCHKLLQVFVSKKLVPDIDPGAIPAMLRDGRFYDGKTQRTYILKEQFMSKYLSRALEYFCKVTNEGVHGSQDSSRLGTAALNILMEFIVWFYENDICSNKLDNIPVNPCYEDITDKLPSLKGKVCTVKAQGAGKDRYLYADNIHIKENKSLKPGMKIKIKDVGAEMIAEDDRRKIDDEYMVFYTSSYDIL